MNIARTWLAALLLLFVAPRPGISQPRPADAGAPPAIASAGGAAAAAPQKPPAEMEQMKFFLGNWICQGTAYPSPFAASEHPVKATARVKADLNGFWQTFVYEEKKTREHPQAVKVMGTWGWNSGAKKFVRADADWFGGWYTPTSPGWDGDNFIWSGEMSLAAGKMPARHTFTRKSDKEFTHTFEVTVGTQQAKIFDVRCKK
jgi:hypothetical protein